MYSLEQKRVAGFFSGQWRRICVLKLCATLNMPHLTNTTRFRSIRKSSQTAFSMILRCVIGPPAPVYITDTNNLKTNVLIVYRRQPAEYETHENKNSNSVNYHLIICLLVFRFKCKMRFHRHPYNIF